MERQFKHLALDFTRVTAVNGRSIPDSELASLVNDDHPNFRNYLMTKSAIGCALSHNNAYEEFLKSDRKISLICEDDVTFTPEITRVLSDLEANWSEGDVVLLFFCGAEKEFATAGEIQLPNGRTINFAIDPGQSYTAAAYVIDRIAAERIRSLNLPVAYTADSWGHFWTHGAVRNLKAVLPPVTKPAHFASDIGYSFIGKAARSLERMAGRPLFGELRAVLGRGIAMKYRVVDQAVRTKKGI